MFFSDLLRTELLVQHGGTWVDATIFCSDADIPPYMLDSDLFLVQTTPVENRIVPTRIESFFITASKNNIILKLCQKIMYEYLQQYNFLIDYYLFYHCFELAIEAFPEEWDKTIYEPRADIFALADEVYSPLNKKKLQLRLNGYPFHKLTYKCTVEKGSNLEYLLSSSNREMPAVML